MATDRGSAAAGGLICVIAAAGVHVGDLLAELDGLGFTYHPMDLATGAALPAPPIVALVVAGGHGAGVFVRDACAALGTYPTLVPIVVVLPAGQIPIADPDLDAHELLVRPLRAGELLSRIDRATAAATGRTAIDLSHRAGALRLDPERRRLWIDDRPVDFSAREFELFNHLARNPASVHSRAQLRNVVWAGEAGVGTRAVDVLVRRVRAKLGDELGGCIRTVRRVGYSFTTPF
jgi:DNA-binding response OmpR family regulator